MVGIGQRGSQGFMLIKNLLSTSEIILANVFFYKEENL